MKRKVTTDSAAFKSAIQLSLLKFNNLEEITFFENHKPPNLSQDEAENLNNPNIGFVIKNSQKRYLRAHMVSLENFTKLSKNSLILSPRK